MKIGDMAKKEYLDKMEDAYQKIMMAKVLLEECDAIVGETRFKNLKNVLEPVASEIYDSRIDHAQEWR